MTEQDPTQPDVTGTAQSLRGLGCEGLVAEAFVEDGRLISPASRVFIKAGRRWYCLTLDAGVIHWRVLESEPKPWAAPERNWSYPHTDVAGPKGLLGLRIEACIHSADESGCSVTLDFEGGRRFTLQERQFADSYTVI